MTINKYLNGLPNMKSADGTTLRETMADVMDIWSNNSCCGYCILAMQAAGYSRDQINQVLKQLNKAFDSTTQDKAEQVYLEF